MGTRPSAGGSSFEWPPSRTDLETINVMDVSRLDPRDWLVAAAAPGAPRRHSSFTPETWTWAAAARSATRADHVLLLAVGILLGTVLPGVDRRADESALVDATATHAAGTGTSPEARQLLAMRALLRGEARASVATPTATSAQPPADARRVANAPPVGADAGAPPRTAVAKGDVAGSSTPGVAGATASTAPADDPSPPSRPGTHVVEGRAVPRTAGWAPDPYTAPVRETVRLFEAAWTRMDASATRAVWPSANETVLARTFTGVREQRLRLAPCRVDRSGPHATATCAGTLRYRPRVGEHSTRVRRSQWAFELERTSAGWVIRSVSTG